MKRNAAGVGATIRRMLSSALAVILAASLPTGAFAQNYATSRPAAPAASAPSAPAAAIQIVPAELGRISPALSLSPASIPPSAIAPTPITVKAAASVSTQKKRPADKPAASAAARSAAALSAPEAAEQKGWTERLAEFFDSSRPLKTLAEPTSPPSNAELTPSDVRLKPSKARQAASIKELKSVLGDGVAVGSAGLIRPFVFNIGSEQIYARTAGLEGFLHRKLELERRHGTDSLLWQWNDYFIYLGDLLAAAPWAGDVRAQLAKLRTAAGTPHDKNVSLNVLLVEAVRDWQQRLTQADTSSWSRQASVYMILARSYNRLKPGKNFFDSLDEDELARIKSETSTNVLWLLDVFEIGEVGRWGTSGGSPYALKGYRFKKELGGEEGARRFIARAKKAGFRVGFDEVPNHTAIDSDQAELQPQDFIHLLPPAQPAPGEDLETYKKNILAQVPQHIQGVYSPLYQLRTTNHYPGHEGRPFWILIHQPITDYGDAMWLDMLQRDYSRQSARDWEIGEMRRQFKDLGTSFARRDMAYYVLNAGYFGRWLYLLNKQKDASTGWVRAELERFIQGFKTRWEQRKGAEFLGEMSDEVRAASPDAAFFDEIYSYETDLSRTGSSGFYNKNDHDAKLGQIGLYDALMEAAFHGDTGRLKAALENISFRSWQRGGASAVNFSVTHDGGEGNPVDKFGKFFRAVAVMSMLFRPTLVYNGLELGVGQREMLIGELSKSQDATKAIPFDVPALINWQSADPILQAFLRRVFEAGERNRGLFEHGAMQVLDAAQATPIVAWAAARIEPETGRQLALLVAGNFSEREAWANFKIGDATLKDFGTFKPSADRDYLFSDLANLDDQGRPRTYTHSGKFLLEKGLPIGLPSAGVHIFEVSEVVPGEPSASVAPASAKSEPQAGPARSAWDSWTEKLTKYSLAPYFFLQIPQVLSNFANIFAGDFAKLAGLPWIGYSTGLLASFMLLSYFNGMKEKAPALTQVMGITMNLIVLGQLAYVGFMPMIAYPIITLTAIGGLILNYLNTQGRANPTLWKLWERGTALMALAAIPPSFFLSLGAVLAWTPAVTAIVSWASGAAAFAAGVALVILDKQGKLPKRLKNVWTWLNAGSATALYTLNPVIGLIWIGLHPASIPGISATTNVLNMLGSMLQFPRGLYLRKGLWVFGNIWAITVGSWVALLAMTLYGALPMAAFAPITAIVSGYLAFIAWHNSKQPAPPQA